VLRDHEPGTDLTVIADAGAVAAIERDINAMIDRGLRQPIEPVVNMARRLEAFEAAARTAFRRDKDAQRWQLHARKVERLAGQMLEEIVQPGRRPASDGTTVGNDDRASSFARKTLADLGVSARQSSDWQALGRLPEEDFHREVQALKDANQEISRAYLVRVSKRLVGPKLDRLATRQAKVRERVQTKLDALKIDGPDRPRGRVRDFKLTVEYQVTVTAVEMPNDDVLWECLRQMLGVGTSSSPFPGDFTATVGDLVGWTKEPPSA
jgi:hypothetical protein